MVKRLLAVMLVLAVLVLPAYALDLKGVFVSVENSWEEKDLDALDMVSVGVPIIPVSGGLEVSVEELELQKNLFIAGYAVSDNFKPYGVLGISNLDFTRKLNGSFKLGPFGGAATVLSTEFDEDLFTYGVGVKGLVVELPQAIKLSYDARALFMSADEATTAVLLPGIIGAQIPGQTDVDYREYSLSLIFSKEFNFAEKRQTEKKWYEVDAIEPFVGYKYTRAELCLENEIYPFISISSEQNLVSDLNSAILGAKVKVNDNLSVSVNGMIGDEEGVVVASTYAF